MDSLLVRLSPGSVEALQEVLPEGFVVDQVVLVVVILYRRVWKGHKYRLSIFHQWNNCTNYSVLASHPVAPGLIHGIPDGNLFSSCR